MGERLHKLLGQIYSELWVLMAIDSSHMVIMGDGVSTLSVFVFSADSFYTCWKRGHA